MHPSLLCERSEYLRGCLQTQFSEANTSKIQLIDVKPISFRYFLKWLYTGDLAPVPTKATAPDGDRWADYKGLRRVMIDVYILADRLLCPALKDRAMDMIRECTECALVDLESLNRVLKSGLASSKLWHYFVRQLSYDMWVNGCEYFTKKEGWVEVVSLDAGFLTAVLLEVESQRKEEIMLKHPAEGQDCDWHEHGEGSCCSGERWPKAQFSID